ncbi:unnamed protein product [Closterium sp. Yama58-4]|nr:unnamed protein product [Closterium sp. Yama58-4]
MIPGNNLIRGRAETETTAAGLLGTTAAVAISSEALEEVISHNPLLSETVQTAFDRDVTHSPPAGITHGLREERAEPEETTGWVGGIGQEQMEEEASERFPVDDLCGSMEERKLLAWSRPGYSALSLRHALFPSFGTITTISLILTLSAALALTLPVLLSSLITSLPPIPFLSTPSPYSSSSQFSSSSTSPSVDDRRLMPASASLTLLRVLALVCVTPLLAFFTRHVVQYSFTTAFLV